MDRDELTKIVDQVIGKMFPENAVPANAGNPKRMSEKVKPPKPVATDSEPLPDLGRDDIKFWVGVNDPGNQKSLADLTSSTLARVAVGRAGPRPRTTTLLRFLADQSLSRDTVFKEVPEEWAANNKLFMVQTMVNDKDQYLTRPDLGRVLSDQGKQTILEKCEKNPQVQIVLSDGLSTDALTANYEEILPALQRGLSSRGLKIGTTFFVKYGRVKVEDQIGELLRADVVVLLIGERPGLGQSESMSSYMVYKPTTETVESERSVISNIHRNGTPPFEAAAVIVDMVVKMLEKKTSGINLNK